MAAYDASETPSMVVGFIILGASALTVLFPWWGKSGFTKVMLHLPPLALLPLYMVYEALMPSRMNIRLDIPMLFGIMGTAGLVYAVKLACWKTFTAKASEQARPEIRRPDADFD